MFDKTTSGLANFPYISLCKVFSRSMLPLTAARCLHTLIKFFTSVPGPSSTLRVGLDPPRTVLSSTRILLTLLRALLPLVKLDRSMPSTEEVPEASAMSIQNPLTARY